jgi:hypothetical protein
MTYLTLLGVDPMPPVRYCVVDPSGGNRSTGAPDVLDPTAAAGRGDTPLESSTSTAEPAANAPKDRSADYLERRSRRDTAALACSSHGRSPHRAAPHAATHALTCTPTSAMSPTATTSCSPWSTSINDRALDMMQRWLSGCPPWS